MSRQELKVPAGQGLSCTAEGFSSEDLSLGGPVPSFGTHMSGDGGNLCIRTIVQKVGTENRKVATTKPHPRDRTTRKHNYTATTSDNNTYRLEYTL